MSIKSLLNKGDINCSTLEKVADTILSGPRGMWLGRNVTVTQNSTGKLDAIDLKSFSFHDKIWGDQVVIPGGGAGGLAVFLFVGIFYILASAALALPLALGLSLKKIAVLKDDKAAQFQKIVDSRLKLDDQITKENELKQNQQKINQTIQDLKDLIDLPSNNPFIGEAKQHAKNRLTLWSATFSKNQESLDQLTREVNELQNIYQKAMENYKR